MEAGIVDSFWGSTSLSALWAAMTVVSLVAALYRAPFARWLTPRGRFWRSRPDRQRLYERSLLLGGLGLAAFSVAALYVNALVLPRLDRTLAQVRSNENAQRQIACPDPI